MRLHRHSVAILATIASWALAEAAEPPGSGAVGILPASVLRKASTDIPSSQLPDFTPHGWAGLVCAPVRCELRPVNLAVLPSGSQSDLRISAAPGPRSKPAAGAYTIVLLRGFTVGAAVPTWFTLRTPRNAQDANNGSMGVTIIGPSRTSWSIVPRWNPAGSDDFLTYYLEARGPDGVLRRQALGRIAMTAVSNGVSPKDLLVWAGDLDGDGKLDLITRTGPKTAQPGLRLWLSSRAEGDDWVGQAAELESWLDIEESEGC